MLHTLAALISDEERFLEADVSEERVFEILSKIAPKTGQFLCLESAEEERLFVERADTSLFVLKLYGFADRALNSAYPDMQFSFMATSEGTVQKIVSAFMQETLFQAEPGYRPRYFKLENWYDMRLSEEPDCNEYPLLGRALIDVLAIPQEPKAPAYETERGQGDASREAFSLVFLSGMLIAPDDEDILSVSEAFLSHPLEEGEEVMMGLSRPARRGERRPTSIMLSRSSGSPPLPTDTIKQEGFPVLSTPNALAEWLINWLEANV